MLRLWTDLASVGVFCTAALPKPPCQPSTQAGILDGISTRLICAGERHEARELLAVGCRVGSFRAGTVWCSDPSTSKAQDGCMGQDAGRWPLWSPSPCLEPIGFCYRKTRPATRGETPLTTRGHRAWRTCPAPLTW